MELRDRFFGAFFGGVLGDVLGMAHEFTLSEHITYDGSIQGGGPFYLDAGDYTDDTSMTIALAASLFSCGSDPIDQITRYISWWQTGKYSVNGHCFDIGTQTERALRYYMDHQSFMHESDRSGNGSLMRVSALSLFGLQMPMNEFNRMVHDSVITTHNNPECITYTTRYAHFVRDIILDDTIVMDNIRTIVANEDVSSYESHVNGYIHGSYYLSLRGFVETSSFMELMDHMITLGGDTDTNACIAGVLGGAHYGYSSFDPSLLAQITHFDMLYDLCEQLYQRITL